MSLTGKSQLRWTFDAAVKQATHDRELQLAEMTKAVNVRRVKDGPPRKRRGYDKTTISTFNGPGTAGFIGPASEVFSDENLLIRDSGGQVFSVSGGEAYHRGNDQRAFPRWQQTGSDLDRVCKPVSVMVSGLQWIFSIGSITSTDAQFLQLTVIDPVTKDVFRDTEQISVTAADICGLTAVASSSEPGVVWVFYFGYNDLTKVRSIKFANLTDPIGTDAAFTTAAQDISSIDALVLASGAIHVAVSYFDTAGGFHNYGHRIAILNQSTGAASSAANVPFSVVDTRTVAPGCITLFGNGTNGSVYVSYWGPDSAADNSVVLKLFTHNATTLANTSVALGTETLNATANPCLSTVAGILLLSGDRVVFSTVIGDPTNGPGVHLTNRYLYNGAASVASISCPYWSYVASKPFYYDGGVYFISGFDDGPTRAQRGYFLRDYNGFIVSTMLDSEGAAIMHAGGLAGYLPDDGSYSYRYFSSHVTTVAVSGTDVFLSLMTEGLTSRAPAPTTVRLSFDEPYHSTLQGVIGGGIPKIVGTRDTLREIAPLLAPHRPLTIYNNGAGPSTHSSNIVTYRYVTINSKGEVIASAAYPLETLTFLTNAAPPLEEFFLQVPTLSHVVGQTWIQIFGSPNGSGAGPFLQHVIENVTAVDSLFVTIFPALWDDAGETLDSLGSALEAQSSPPARLASYWRNRPVLGGTSDGRIYFGFEQEAGRGHRFNAVLAVSWNDGTGEQTAQCPGGWDFFAVFKQDAVGIVTGSGPDGIGLGAYEVQTLNTDKGISMDTPGACGHGPSGVYFQNAADLRPCLIANGTVVEIHRGAEDYVAAGYVVTSVVHSREDREMHFYCSNGKIMRLDYAHPTADQPYGQWYLSESSGLVETVGAVAVGTSIVHVDNAGTTTLPTWSVGTGFDDDGAAVLKTMEFGRLPAAGVLGEFDTFEAQLSSEILGSGSAYTYTLTDSQGTTETHADVANSVPDVAFMTNLNRTREFRLKIQETSGSGEGRMFDGGVMEIGTYKRPQDARRRIG